MKHIDELQKENDELKAHCFELEAALAHSLCQTSNTGTHPIDNMDWVEANKLAFKILESAPQQSLNEIKAQAIEEVIESCATGVPMRCAELTYTLHDLILLEDAKDYANKLRGEK